jgi:hypothetical protein
MRRREFIGLVGGMVLAWPRAVMAQGAANRPVVAVLVAGTAVNYTYARSLEGLRVGAARSRLRGRQAHRH